VAGLADLGDLQHRRADLDASPESDRLEIDTAGGDILGEVAGTEGTTAVAGEAVDLFLGQQADLPVPVAGMGIPGQPPGVMRAAATGCLGVPVRAERFTETTVPLMRRASWPGAAPTEAGAGQGGTIGPPARPGPVSFC